ncbi:sensor histidine kinase [Massilia sp. DD77]|uniref:sensor histidine kinase n=1 Tax=Massilia sp. DD77 TaxID=3109349 RepID=UPI002FFF79E5
MASAFFPSSRQFWLYHLGVSACCAAVTLLTIVLWSPLAAQDSAAIAVWFPAFTLAVLVFRQLYKARHWQRLPMGRLIALAVVYGSVAAVLVALCASALTLPFFLDGMAAWYAGQGMRLDLGAYLLRTVASNSLQAQVFICAWIFIYISVTGRRDARARELDHARVQAALREAQLRSLSNQLNPHFLFNSLNNIRFMIHEDAGHADAMLVGLSEILRYSLRAHDGGKVRLGEEVEIIRRYLAIVGVQLEERLRFSIEIPDALHDRLVPPLLLQMLVENAVKHGLEPLREGGALALGASARDGRLHVELVNDKPASAAAGGLGIGTGHVAQRLALLYGARAAHAAFDDGARFRVSLTLPEETLA